MQADLISVIVPVHNAALYLNECLTSLREQTYPQLEIILVDDGSTDGSAELCEHMAAQDERFKVVRQKQNGPGPSRNVGLELCTGQYLTFVDADDYVDRDLVAVLYRELVAQQADVAICRYLCQDEVTGKSYLADHQFQQSFYGDSASFLQDFFRRPVAGFVWGKLYRRELFRQLRFENIEYGEDVLLWLPLCRVARCFAVSSQVKYHYRLHPGSLTNKQNFTMSLGSLDRVWGKVWQGLVPYGKAYALLGAGNYYYYAYISFLNYIILAGQEANFRTEIHQVQMEVRRDLPDILVNPNLSVKAKLASLVLVLNMRLYKILCGHFVDKHK